MALFKSFLQAGFECGYLEPHQQDLLVGTNHIPQLAQRENYDIVKTHGLYTARDGLPYRHDAYERIKVANDVGMEIIWDACHYDPPLDPTQHARNIALAGHGQPLWVCPMNEPSICPMFTDLNKRAATELGVHMMNVMADHHSDVRFITTDPITGEGEFEYEPTDAFVATGRITVVGVNYYPHTSHEPLSNVLVRTYRRYGLPVMVAETSWHNHHEEQMRRYPQINNKANWLHLVLQETRKAIVDGAQVEGVCWYPIVSSPAWGDISGNNYWDHGLIHQTGLDSALSNYLLNNNLLST